MVKDGKEEQSYECFCGLLQKGVDYHIKTLTGHSILHLASLYSSTKIIKHILENLHDVDIKGINEGGQTALEICQEKHNIEGVNLIIKHTGDYSKDHSDRLLMELLEEEEKEQETKGKKKAKRKRNKMNKLAKQLDITPNELTDRLKHGEENEECLICLIKVDSIKQRATLNCGHNYFHKTCFDEWIKKNPSCPYCKDVIEVKPQSKIEMKKK